MGRSPHHDTGPSSPGPSEEGPFLGYPKPPFEATGTPEQFFEVVLPHSSRGVVRLVGYMIRKVLGKSNPDGSPQETRVRISYSELTSEAGISRGAIRDSIDEALQSRFITCVTEGSRNHREQAASSSLFELRWDASAGYTTDPEQFQGFFSGPGHRMDVPNAFFDYTVRNQPLALVRVVGAILWHSIGPQTPPGIPNTDVTLSFDELLGITRLGSRSTLSLALKEAESGAHIVRLESGSLRTGSPSKGRYAIRWRPEPSQAPTIVPPPSRAVPERRIIHPAPGGYPLDPRPATILDGSQIKPASEQKPDRDRAGNRPMAANSTEAIPRVLPVPESPTVGPIRVVAPTQAEALEEVRRRAGPDALVIHVKRVPRRGLARLWGGSDFEVLASPRPGPKAMPDAPSDPQASSGAGPFSDPDPLSALLLDLGLVPEVVRPLTGQLHLRSLRHQPIQEQWTRCAAELLQRWDRARGRLRDDPSRIVLVGPEGTGKSTCIAKWMTRERLVRNQSCRLWRFDIPTVNAGEFLALHAEMLGIPVERFWSPAEPADREWVDLPGWSPGNPEVEAQVANLLDRFRPDFVGLVLNGACELSLLLRQVEGFRSLRPHGILLTHLDEETRAAKLWNILLATHLPICHVSSGAAIPAGFSDCRSEDWLEKLLSQA